MSTMVLRGLLVDDDEGGEVRKTAMTEVVEFSPGFTFNPNINAKLQNQLKITPFFVLFVLLPAIARATSYSYLPKEEHLQHILRKDFLASTKLLS